MGKPFEKELDNIINTYQWAIKQNIDELKSKIVYTMKSPVIIVGSGGSLSACYFAALLYQQRGILAKVITPLELIYSSEVLRNAAILFISASGRNTDILFSYKKAIKSEPFLMINICMSANNPLSQLSKKQSISKAFDFSLPTKKDGFLATNSLIAFFSILYKTFNEKTEFENSITIEKEFPIKLKSFINKVSPEFTFTILFAGLSQPIAIDIESKLAEAALANVLYSDYRNFGHGRHHWFAKRKEKSAIIALVTPNEKKLAFKTLSLIPKDVPVLILETKKKSTFASIELLFKSFYFVNELGKIQSIDPGRPGVPDFGSKLYHLNYQKFYSEKKDAIPDSAKLAISRKIENLSFKFLSVNEKKFWLQSYRDFTKRILTAEFGSILFDYDGTLCSSANRYIGIDNLLISKLKKLLEFGITVGIATGRGQSVRLDFQKIIPKKYWEQIIIGYYNGSDSGFLSENTVPDKKKVVSPVINFIFKELKKETFIVDIIPELKPNQITIEVGDKTHWHKVRTNIIELVATMNQPCIQIVESSHSLDIIDQNNCNKLLMVDRCSELAHIKNKSTKVLCIGDKGKLPGNDFRLLSSAYSLSVDEVSSLPNSCWNLAKAGVKNIDATIFYLSQLDFGPNGFKIKLQ